MERKKSRGLLNRRGLQSKESVVLYASLPQVLALPVCVHVETNQAVARIFSLAIKGYKIEKSDARER